MVEPLSTFSFQPVLYDWYNTGRGMCCPLCGMVHIKEPLLLTEGVAQTSLYVCTDIVLYVRDVLNNDFLIQLIQFWF